MRQKYYKQKPIPNEDSVHNLTDSRTHRISMTGTGKRTVHKEYMGANRTADRAILTGHPM